MQGCSRKELHFKDLIIIDIKHTDLKCIAQWTLTTMYHEQCDHYPNEHMEVSFMLELIFKKLFKNVFICEMQRETETYKAPPSTGSALKFLPTAMAPRDKARIQELTSGRLCEWQETNYLSHHHCFHDLQQQEVGIQGQKQICQTLPL